jgi:alkanesulfonate monooxygenase SsuD/methylene tetrahydromethanopterin reductase-like flavin-dependent oxidoreductase (luciferase family)
MRYRFSLMYDMRAPEFGARPVDLYQAALDQIEWGDRVGIQSLILMEHHATTDGYLPSPLVMGGAAAARTKSMAIVISLMLLPLYHPLRAAEDLAVLDLLSNGRLVVMVGAGYREEEYAQFGLSIKKRPSLMEEGIETLRRAWTGEPFEFRGQTVRILPRPAQSPGPPIIMGGSSNAAAVRAARIADGFSPTNPMYFEAYREELAKLGKPVPPPAPTPSGPQVMFLHIAEDPDAAWKQIAPHAMHESNDYGRWGRGMNMPYKEVASADELRASGVYQVLTPAETVDYVRRTGGLALKPLMGGLDPAIGWKSLELFEQEVLPKLRADG